MSTHQLNLNPTDVLFFKDGRPMDGASSGNGAAWPMPHVLDAALHAAMHRSQEEAHSHTPKRYGKDLSKDRSRFFGSLQSAGPFPVDEDGNWHFPRPADADLLGSSETTHHVLFQTPEGSSSSLPDGILPVINTQVSSKNKPEKWLNTAAYQTYLGSNESPNEPHYLHDEDIFAAEHNIGIGIDPATNTQDGEQFYSASYLRLEKNWSIGLIVSCMDKGKKGDHDNNATADLDLIAAVFPNSGSQTHIIAGGQQRTATVQRKTPETPETIPLPIGKSDNFTKHEDKHLVRWTLLTPAIFPKLEGEHQHSGGWLPNWIAPENYTVELLDGPGKNAARRRNVPEGKRIPATLIATRIPSAIPVTGWSLGKADEKKGFGPKSTHLAVPAGAVYYFACDSPEDATQLAKALNWHGTSEGTEIQNRRSTLLGEKGYGLGVCSSWQPAEKH